MLVGKDESVRELSGEILLSFNIVGKECPLI